MALYHIIGYLIIFLPLLSCLFCLLVNIPRSNFIIFTASNILISFFAAFLLFLLPSPDIHIISNVSDSIISPAINYDISILSLFFVILIAVINLVTSIFYRNILGNNLNEDSKKLFYVLNLINLFGIVGIFTASNIINFYLFIEIYCFTFYAISCSSREKSLNKLAFKYFYQGSCGSILMLISLFLLFLSLDSVDFKDLLPAISNIEDSQIFTIALIFIIFSISIIFKFFPFWLYFENIKSSNFLSHFLSSRFLFIKANIGFYIIIKSIFLIFGTDFVFGILNLDLVLLLLGGALIAFANIKILGHNNLKVITSYYCLIYIGFFLCGIAINSSDSLFSIFSYIIHYSTVGLLLMLFCAYMVNNFHNCNIRNLNLVRGDKLTNRLMFNVTILLTFPLPLTFSFIANWTLSSSALQPEFYIISLIFILMTFCVLGILYLRMMSYFYFNKKNEGVSSFNNLQDNIYYLISFIIVICIVIIFAINPKIILDIFRNLSLYLL